MPEWYKQWFHGFPCLKTTITTFKKLGSASVKATELTANWPQPWCPLHAPKLLWSRLIKATVGHQPQPSRPKWDDTGLSVLFEKRMLHLWLVALCVHVVMWSSICPSSHRYHGISATHAWCIFLGFPFGARGSGFGSWVWGFFFFFFLGTPSALSVFVSRWLWPQWSSNHIF